MINLKTKNWAISNIDTILFDKDGTLIDLHYFWGKMTELRAKEVINTYNLPVETFSQLCLYLGYDINSKKMLEDGITALYSRSKIIEIFRNNLKNLNVETSEEKLAGLFDEVSEIFYKNIETYTKPIPSAINFVKKIKAYKLKTGIVTSDSVKSTEITIKNNHWETLFDTVVGRESSNQTKESGALTQIALKNLNSNPLTTIMIGDAPMDKLSADNSGISDTILVATGQIGENNLKQISKYVLNDLSEILVEEI